MDFGMRRTAPAVACGLLAAATCALGAASFQAPDVQAGQAVYDDRKCATCHMVAGKGNMRFPLDGIAARLSVEDLRRWLTDTAEMEGALARQPAVRMSEWMDTNRKISDRDLAALVAYLATLK